MLTAFSLNQEIIYLSIYSIYIYIYYLNIAICVDVRVRNLSINLDPIILKK